MRGSAWPLAAAGLIVGGLLPLASFSQIPLRRPTPPASAEIAAPENSSDPIFTAEPSAPPPLSTSPSQPSLSIRPGDPGRQNLNPQTRLKETEDRLQAFEAENEALRRRNDTDKETIRTLTESLAVANAECEVFRRQMGELKLRMEALGLAAVGDNKEALEQRLLQSVRDLALVRTEKDSLAERLVALAESVMLFLKTATSEDPKARLDMEAQLRSANSAVNQADAKEVAGKNDAPADLTNGRVDAVKEEFSLIVVNLGSRQGVKVGMPFLVTRDGKLVARARVVDVRERISGAIVEEYSSVNEKVKVGDRMHVDVES